MVSFARPEQIQLVAEIAQSFALDNGAYANWRSGRTTPAWDAYYGWVEEWRTHPAFDFALIPDVVDGNCGQNDALISEWPFSQGGVPVFHLDEPVKRLVRLGGRFGRVALGSSGRFRNPGTRLWWTRMCEVMRAVCDQRGRPLVRLHGLRMLSPAIIRRVPLASADSTSICRNVNLDVKWNGTYQPATRMGRALALRERIESAEVATKWTGR